MGKWLIMLVMIQMRAVVKDIATLFPTSIITGRSREKVLDHAHSFFHITRTFFNLGHKYFN